MLNGLPWKWTEIILSFSRLHNLGWPCTAWLFAPLSYVSPFITTRRDPWRGFTVEEVYIHTHVHMLCHVWVFVILWTIAHKASLSIGFSRQEYWSRLPFLPPGNLLDTVMKLASPALAGGFFTTESPGKPIIEDSGFLKKCQGDSLC